MKIAICGGSGLIGSALVDFSKKNNHDIIIVSRKAPDRAAADPATTYVTWDELKHNPEPLEGLDALVNLAGENLNQRWTSTAKKRILQSRLDTVASVASIIAALKHKPKVVIQASAMGIYGTSDTATFVENSPTRTDTFLAEVSSKWEQAADAIRDTRLVKLRITVVLSNKGGAYPLLRLPYKLGVGGKMGDGQQWTSWVHIADMVGIINHCIHDTSISGPVNAVAPHPVRNEDFGQTIAKVYHRPHWLKVPGFAVSAAMGEASELVLEGQKVLPAKLLEHGYTFQFPTLEKALEALHREEQEGP
ncbi:TIGR01777 family oxidoreductase [Paenibacillus massiliensis]|uniref:TIGR01777 family oxidoreductase n=1 Tax=Paenibacillus massiliensis TaxID=225917 RepID=UPI0003F53327|nr:TIGR01777 family oxidoreductase [Paenibacillus massiliensis]